MTTILHITSSTTGDASKSNLLSGELVERLVANDAGATVVRRDLEGVPLLTTAATAEMASAAGEHSPAAAPVLGVSDELIAELKAADVLVIGSPIYNFSVPASLKAWADLVARVGHTFHYTEQGPAGLLEDRPAYIVAAAGGVPIGSDMDFNTSWLSFFLGFMGIANVTTIAASGFAFDADGALATARESIAAAPLP